MSTNTKLTIIGAVIVMLIAAAGGVVFFTNTSGSIETRLSDAEEFLDNGDYGSAIAIFNEIISEDASCANAYAGLSEAYYAEGMTDKALEILEEGAENTDNSIIIANMLEDMFPELYEEDVKEAEKAASETETVSEPETETTAAAIETAEAAETTGTAETTEATDISTATAPAATTATTTSAAAAQTTAASADTTAVPETTAASSETTTTTAVTTEEPREFTMPDFTSMSLDDAYAWCSKHNIILNAKEGENNSGEILSQSPAPGSPVKENSEIIVILS